MTCAVVRDGTDRGLPGVPGRRHAADARERDAAGDQARPAGESERTVVEELNDDIVHRLEISPDGRWGLLLSDSGPSYVVELSRPTESGFRITSTGGTMNRHAFSRNGQWLATAAGPMEMFPELQVEEPEFVVRLRNLVRQRLGEIALDGHDDLITDVTFSPDGNRLATCSVDRTIRLWDLSELNALSELLARCSRLTRRR